MNTNVKHDLQPLRAKRTATGLSAARRVRIALPMNARFLFAGTEFFIAGDAALFWPAQRALLVADLHLEKASSFAVRGQMLPPYDSRATLESLKELAVRFDVRSVYCLGDNFHDNGGEARLEVAAVQLLRQMTSSYAWHWIIGNHDPGLSAEFGGQTHVELSCSGIILRHEADPSEPQPEISGHFHPKLRQILRGRSISRRCFVRSDNKLILPAFGALTGGLDADHPAITSACAGQKSEAIIAAAGRALCFPLNGALAE